MLQTPMERTLGGGWSALEPSSAGYLHDEQLTIWPIQIVLSGVKEPLNFRWPHKTRPSFNRRIAGNGSDPAASRGFSNLLQGHVEDWA